MVARVYRADEIGTGETRMYGADEIFIPAVAAPQYPHEPSCAPPKLRRPRAPTALELERSRMEALRELSSRSRAHRVALALTTWIWDVVARMEGHPQKR